MIFTLILRMSVASEKTADALQRNADLLNSHGITTQILKTEEIKERYPEINMEDLVLGAWGPDDGLIDPHMIMLGYIKKAQEMGVKLYQGVKATDIQVRNRKIEGGHTDEGFISSRIAVNAGGPWAKEIGRWVDVKIPLINLARTSTLGT